MTDRERTLPILPDRDCGACRECCIHVPVEPFDKPAGVKCSHLTRTPQACGSCRIYASRPQACADYVCSWKVAGWLHGEAFRPDRCGLLFEHSWFFDPIDENRVFHVFGYEIKPGAFLKAKRRLMKHCPPDTIVSVHFRDDRDPVLLGGDQRSRLSFARFTAACEAQGFYGFQGTDRTVIQEIKR